MSDRSKNKDRHTCIRNDKIFRLSLIFISGALMGNVFLFCSFFEEWAEQLASVLIGEGEICLSFSGFLFLNSILCVIIFTGGFLKCGRALLIFASAAKGFEISLCMGLYIKHFGFIGCVPAFFSCIMSFGLIPVFFMLELSAAEYRKRFGMKGFGFALEHIRFNKSLLISFAAAMTAVIAADIIHTFICSFIVYALMHIF